ncbi:trna ligase [Coemansia brasiliensis]|uniref:tRNA ligase n=1 Tax=Coemansia brasiliensis TaxID=2650707 RepID=A0A9W8IC42_9FUNG|nr:trna ligase [Coemansia brasiliensis]
MSTRSIATRSWGPLTEKEQYEFRQLMGEMHKLASVKPASKRIVRHTAHEFAGREIISWKCTEYLYKKEPCPLPTKARGLFTLGEDSEEKIVARGYDKFFNINEVSKTKWAWIEANTHGPYELTVKENGCIILASSLDDGKTLLVTSKHAVNVPHAEVGRKWMERHLSQAGKTTEDLAAFLHENNATAVFELCDDDFEEHILEYTGRMRGLYLHGINRNAVELDTWPSADVTRVAQEYGFHITKYFNFDNVQEGHKFADKVREEHVLDGRAIEGFVVRCQINGTDMPFMFKIKYDEPYLMFREWREVTNRILAEKPYRTSYPLSKHYVAWVKRQLKSNVHDFAEFGKQKGIIGARKRFLEYYKQTGGSEAEIYSQMSGETKVLLVPVATIGCGKTTVSLALSRLFGFGHVQNDNITVKKNPRGAFHNAILKQFDHHDFVIADRNNHLWVLRETLTSTVRSEIVNCRIVALYWTHENASAEDILAHNIDRVVSRGESHQSLTPGRAPDFRKIMRNFVTSFTPLDLETPSDSLIEDVIELDPLADSATNLKTAIDALCNMFPDMLKRPSEKEVEQALEHALAFKPTIQKVVGKERKPAFFGLVPNGSFDEMIKQTIHDSGNEVCRDMMATSSYDRVYHVTLAHIAKRKNLVSKAIFNGYVDLFKKDNLVSELEAACTADYIVCNESIIALRIKSMTIDGSNEQLPDAIVKRSKHGEKMTVVAINNIPHITLGLKETKAVQANEMLKEVFGPNNADAPLRCPDGWAVVPVKLEFLAKFASFMD